MSLNNLAIRLAEVGERQEALEPAREAVELRRKQAAQNAAYRADLAAAERTVAALTGDSEDEVGETASPK